MRPPSVFLASLGAALLLAGAGGLGKGEEPPGLYELTARSELVVSARVFSGSTKLAQVRVLEVFRGPARPGQRLQIAFRDFNMSLAKEDRVVFTDGEDHLSDIEKTAELLAKSGVRVLMIGLGWGVALHYAIALSMDLLAIGNAGWIIHGGD